MHTRAGTQLALREPHGLLADGTERGLQAGATAETTAPGYAAVAAIDRLMRKSGARSLAESRGRVCRILSPTCVSLVASSGTPMEGMTSNALVTRPYDTSTPLLADTTLNVLVSRVGADQLAPACSRGAKRAHAWKGPASYGLVGRRCGGHRTA